jgi:hypothetical protein
MPKTKPRPFNPTQKRVIDLVVQWKATPEPLRQHNSLREFAIANGIKPSSDFYHLANSPDVFHQLLVGVAGNAIQATPDILEALADKARSGHVRAAEVFLDFVRKTITDESMIRSLRPTASVQTLLEEVKTATNDLLSFVQSLPESEEEAKASLQEEATDTTFIEELANTYQQDTRPTPITTKTTTSNDTKLLEPIPEQPQ